MFLNKALKLASLVPFLSFTEVRLLASSQLRSEMKYGAEWSRTDYIFPGLISARCCFCRVSIS